ncbi:unnamed protein product [Hydatigera taeniaeformis]|uniref:AGC-kinase C-terminal domain-containing protein n=1 Tax=Hydatigena taeniaeformis TaxID=6205 RepID=A0A0R3X642_HYDTA|nr:unnamed protein product [Hydatigera taeniaeformis]
MTVFVFIFISHITFHCLLACLVYIFSSVLRLTVLFSTDLDITPPWKPDVNGDMDTKYIPEEFQRENVAVTPPEKSVYSDFLDQPYFQRFSYHGSRQSLSRQSVLSFGDNGSIPEGALPN